MSIEEHWENIYGTKDSKQVSWYADHVASSLERIESLKLRFDAAILDLGGGASTLVDDLLEAGHTEVSVMDISGAAMDIARQRLGQRASRANWIRGDVLLHVFEPEKFDLWHDRAVFHFLTGSREREIYRNQAARAVKPDGYLLLSVFADDGPEKCSGLVIRRHSEKELEQFFEQDFGPISHSRFTHRTPGGSEQRFVSVLLRKKSKREAVE
jgi:SAM-dependent methyltransferase